MANYKDAKKRILIAERNRQHNVKIKSEVKTAVKKVHKAIADGNTQELEQVAQRAIVSLDRARSKGVLNHSHVARHKSRVMKHVNETLQQAQS